MGKLVWGMGVCGWGDSSGITQLNGRTLSAFCGTYGEKFMVAITAFDPYLPMAKGDDRQIPLKKSAMTGLFVYALGAS